MNENCGVVRLQIELHGFFVVVYLIFGFTGRENYQVKFISGAASRQSVSVETAKSSYKNCDGQIYLFSFFYLIYMCWGGKFVCFDTADRQVENFPKL